MGNGLVYAVGTAGTVHGLDAATGEQRWSAELGDFLISPVLADGVLYVGVKGQAPFDSRHPSLDPSDGDPSAEATPVPATPTAAEAAADAASFARLLALDAATGDRIWAVGLDGLRSPPAVVDGVVYLVGPGAAGTGALVGTGTDVRAFDAADGTERWSFSARDSFETSPSVADGTVFIGSSDSNLYALDAATGRPRWQVATAGPIATAAFVADGAVVVRSGDGNLYAIGGSDASPGTPAVTSAPTGDVSGRPPCDIEPRPELPPGTPAFPQASTPIAISDDAAPNSLVPVTDRQRLGNQPFITWDDLPPGAPADADAIAGITETLGAMAACARPGRERQLAAFYSDDFYRRPWVRWQLASAGYWNW